MAIDGVNSLGMRRLREAFPHRALHIYYNPDSPWLLVDVGAAWGEEATPENAVRKFAIWIQTGNVYDVDETGVVTDDPIPDNANPRDIR